MICRNCGKSFEGDVCPDCGTPADGTEQANAPAEAQTDGAEVVVKNTKVCGRYFAYRIAAAFVLFIGSFSLAMYALTGEKSQMASAGMVSGIALGIASAMALVLIFVTLASVKRPVSRKLMTALLVVAVIGLFYGGVFASFLSTNGSGGVNVFKIVFTFVTLLLSTALMSAGMGAKNAESLAPVTRTKQKVSYAVSGAAVLLTLILALIPVLSTLGNPLRNADKISLGMTKSEVVDIMGEADTDGNGAFVWYDRKTAKTAQKLADLEEEVLQGNMDAMEEMMKLTEELASMEGQSLTVYITSGTVTGVEFNADSSVTEKKATSASTATVVRPGSGADATDDGLTVEVNAVYQDESWSKMYGVVSIDKMTLDLAGECFEIEWKYAFGDVKTVSGTLEATISELKDSYKFLALERYDRQFGYDDLKDASQETKQAYAALCEKYGVDSEFIGGMLDEEA